MLPAAVTCTGRPPIWAVRDVAGRTPARRTTARPCVTNATEALPV